MSSPILVTGGTGTLGRLVVPHLLEAAGRVRVLSRRSREDSGGVEFVTGELSTDEGIEAAVTGAEIIVHCAGSPKGDDGKARSLVRAAQRAGVRHLVFISVVGADRVPVASAVDRALFGYFGAKLAAEQVVADSGLPWTTLRATQFYDSLPAVARQMARLPVIPVPSGVRFQPVDTGEVAARLAELALSEPAGLVPDLAGPRTYAMADLIRGSGQRNHGRPDPLEAGTVHDDAMLKRQRRMPPSRRGARGNVLFHAGNEAVERLGQPPQEAEDLLTLQPVLHHREAHQVQAEVGGDGGRLDRLAEPVQVGGVAELGEVVETQRAPLAGHLVLYSQHAAVHQPAQGRVERTRAGLVQAGRRCAEHLLQPVAGARLTG
jgi:uncharacterized protein YbjT (DUF2867 family)